MSFQEKNAWIVAIGLILALAFYGFEVLGAGLGGASLKTVIVAVAGFVIVVVVGHILVAARSPRDAGIADERDRMVDRRTDRFSEIALSVVVLGILTHGLLNQDYVVASIAFLGLFGAALLKQLMMIVLYRTGV